MNDNGRNGSASSSSSNGVGCDAGTTTAAPCDVLPVYNATGAHLAPPITGIVIPRGAACAIGGFIAGAAFALWLVSVMRDKRN